MPTQAASLAIVLAASWWDRNSGAVGLAGLIVTAIALVAAIVFYLLQRDKKTFDWLVLTNEPIMTGAAKKAKGKIKMTLNDNVELRHPRLLTVRLANTGRKEIRPEDFDGLTTIKVRSELRLKSASVIRIREGMRRPPALTVSSDDALRIERLLYNRGDWVDIQPSSTRLTKNSSGPKTTNGRMGGRSWARAPSQELRGSDAAVLN